MQEPLSEERMQALTKWLHQQELDLDAWQAIHAAKVCSNRTSLGILHPCGCRLLCSCFSKSCFICLGNLQ